MKTELDDTNSYFQHLLETIPESVFGDLYKALLHSWKLQSITNPTVEDIHPFQRAHEDFVAILKTANLGDLVEKLHDALAKQAKPRVPDANLATTMLVSDLVSYVGRVRILNVRDRVWRRLISCVRISDGPLEGDYRVGTKGDDGKLLVNPMPAHAPVAVLPLHELQEVR